MRALLMAGLVMTASLRGGDLESARAVVARFEARAPLAGRLSEIYGKPLDGKPESGPRAELSIQVSASPAALD